MFSFIKTKSLRRKLILYFLVITIVPSVIISYCYFKISQNNLRQSMVDSSSSELVYSMDIIDKQLKNAGQFSDWIFVNRSFDNVLTKSYFRQNVLLYDSGIENVRQFIDYQLLSNSPVGVYISSLIIYGKNGMDLRAGNDGPLINKTEIQKTDWFKKGIALGGKVYWYGIVRNPAGTNHDEYILPLARPILHFYKNQVIGWHMIGFRIALIGDLLKNLEIKKDETLLVVDTRGSCVYHNDKQLIGRDLSKLNYVRKAMKQSLNQYINIEINGTKRLVVFAKSKLTGWTIIKILSPSELKRQQMTLFKITLVILLSGFIFTSFLTIYLSNHLMYKLARLLQQIKAIAVGNFYRDPSIEGEDELGILGHGINEMAVNIRNLLDQAVKNEQEKRRLELEMLQYQVNPHFLYNTLNSLKLMATIQKADGIKEMVAALGRLIMNLSKNSSEKITLEEEIALLNDYVYIQNIRYKGKIKLEYRIGSQDYLKCKIIKFTLQPIVENAIFHGIEPKKDAGRIVIDITENNDRLIICIEDDGVGMTPEQITLVLSKPAVEKPRGLSGIGVKNVDERIKLTYGPEFGLTIESVPDQYTQVNLVIPLER